MLSPLPRRSDWDHSCSFSQPYQPSPKWRSGRPAQRPFRGLLSVHSRYGLHTRAATIFAARFTGGFNRFVASTVAPVASGWSRLPGGILTHWESAALPRRTPKAAVQDTLARGVSLDAPICSGRDEAITCRCPSRLHQDDQTVLRPSLSEPGRQPRHWSPYLHNPY